MSCGDAPINITSSAGTCELKCEYSFDYKDSNVVLTNEGNYLKFNYDLGSSPQVKYNAEDYNPREVRLYIPSIHKYQGRAADAELIIVHSSGSKNLIVSVPITQSRTTSRTTKFLDQVANYVASFTPSSGDTASMGNAVWNLNDWVPEKPYFSYSGSAPYSPCAGGFDYVVFNIYEAATIHPDALSKLKKHVSSSGIGTKNNTFYNSTGPARQGLDSVADDDIYISCQPTGTSDDQEVVGGQQRKQPTNFFAEAADYVVKGDLLNSPVTVAIASALVMVLVYKVGTMTFGRKRSQ